MCIYGLSVLPGGRTCQTIDMTMVCESILISLSTVNSTLECNKDFFREKDSGVCVPDCFILKSVAPIDVFLQTFLMLFTMAGSVTIIVIGFVKFKTV